MSDFTAAQQQRSSEQRIDFTDNQSQANGPNAFQDFAANVWSPQGGASFADRFAGNQSGRGGHGGGPIPEIPGVLTKLEGVTNAPKTEVTVQAKVDKILPDFDNPRNGLVHEQFLIKMSDGTDVFVAHDLNYAPRVPLQVGEDIKLKGEWIPTNENHGGVDTIGVLHWTHHSEDEHRHQSGYIEAGGQHYE
jgi:hypothetical protein